MEEFSPETQPAAPSVRPTVLTVLCILTFVGSGMNLFSSLFIAGFYDTFIEIAGEFGKKFNIPGMEMLEQMTPAYFLSTGLLYAVSIAGAILMMKMRKAGFHVYTISQILLLLAPMYFLKTPGPDTVQLIFSGLFILLYSRHFKAMS